MDCEVELQGGDLHAGVITEANPVGFGTMEDSHALAVSERDMWLNSDQDEFLGVNDASMFYADFPPLPDFPCMSSSSSSSSAPPLPAKTMACSTTTTTTSSSSSSSSWVMLRSDVEEDAEKNHCNHYMHDQLDATALSSTASMEISQQHNPDPALGGTVGECMEDVMDTFGYMELLESNDFFDPASIFQEDNEDPLVEFGTLEEQVPLHDEQHAMVHQKGKADEEDHQVPVCEEIHGEEEGGDGVGVVDDEMSNVFLEWLKSNKDSVSANDLRNVKLKKATIESAARRLGGGKEAMKQLLKLILEWVQTSHLQNKRRKENSGSISTVLQGQFQDPSVQNTHTGSFAPEPNSCFNNQTPWLSPQPFGTDQNPLMVPSQQFPQPMVGYVGDPYTSGAASNNITATHNHNNNPYQPGAEQYHMLESAHSWPHSQFNVASHYGQSFGENGLFPHGGFGGYGNNQYPYQFFHGPGDRLMRLGPSATKEARKKRMARQRRFLSHHRNHNGNHQQNQGNDPHATLGGDNCTNVVAAPHANHAANWMYWQAMTAGVAGTLGPVVPAEPPAGQPVVDRSTIHTQNCHQSRVASDRRQGWKPEKNLRFLLQKVLKQSDVGSLGRIVLPKKEAETHLPELEARDGISITMEDIGTSRVWNMRYRYWPNNKSRMYLLENTGDFVRANGLQEGDFIVIYSDVKCGKYMIRGVKVRQQGVKPETKKGGKSQKNQHGTNASTTAGTAANNGTQSSTKPKAEKSSKLI
uniref:ABI-3 homolog n=1 Tax=Psophocarpus tetragonolobus TaxID=3891 RepID=Q68AN0_PSOTE|nr:ABI-3 homolog [Psophocarpus tetragonolobus]